MTAGELRKALEFADEEAPVILAIFQAGDCQDVEPAQVTVMVGNPGNVRIVAEILT